MKRAILVALFTLLPAVVPGAVAEADVIRLKSGFTIQGTVIHRDERQIIVELRGLGKMSLSWQRIVSIEPSSDGAPVGSLPDRWKIQLDGLLANLEALRDHLEDLRLRQAWEAYVRPKSAPQPENVTRLADTPKPEAASQLAPGEASAPAPMPARRIPLWAIVLSVIAHAYAALCLQLIARKTNTPGGWTAWVPFLNGLLAMRISRRSVWWWLVVVLVYLFSDVGGALAAIVLGLNVAAGIANVRARPDWLGLLLFIPGINLVVLGYLAFTE